MLQFCEDVTFSSGLLQVFLDLSSDVQHCFLFPCNERRSVCFSGNRKLKMTMMISNSSFQLPGSSAVETLVAAVNFIF